MNILIITGGDIREDFASSFVKGKNYDEIIAVDGGLAAADCLGIRPTHLVGDFDTIRPDILDKYMAMTDIQIHAFDPVKDNTDMDIAVLLAIKLCKGREKSSRIDILGALGSRADHMLANLLLLLKPHRAGIPAFICDPCNRISVAGKDQELIKSQIYGDFISLIPLTERVGGLTLEGFKYPLDQAETFMGDSLCVSNELTAPIGHIHIGEGCMLLVESKDA